jgi:hypothetical protein
LVQSSRLRMLFDVLIVQKFHAVAPFYPLEQPAMEQILVQKIHQWNHRQQQQLQYQTPSFMMTRAAVQALVDPSRVEYLTMVKRSTQTPLLTFSSAGAHILHDGSPRMNAWQASVKRCLFRDWNYDNANSQTSDDDGDDECQLKEQPPSSLEPSRSGEDIKHQQQYAILDYDTTTQKGVLWQCPNTEIAADKNDPYPTPSCKDLCRFSL